MFLHAMYFKSPGTVDIKWIGVSDSTYYLVFDTRGLHGSYLHLATGTGTGDIPYRNHTVLLDPRTVATS